MAAEVRARVRVHGPGVSFVEEDRLADVPPDPDEWGRLGGQIVIDDGVAEVAVEDELLTLVRGLCFDAVVDLAQQEHAVMRHVDHYGYVRLDREASLVRISGDDVPDVRMPMRPVGEALVRCGSRVLDWIEGSPGSWPSPETRALLREREAAAREALPALAGDVSG